MYTSQEVRTQESSIGIWLSAFSNSSWANLFLRSCGASSKNQVTFSDPSLTTVRFQDIIFVDKQANFSIFQMKQAPKPWELNENGVIDGTMHEAVI